MSRASWIGIPLRGLCAGLLIWTVIAAPPAAHGQTPSGPASLDGRVVVVDGAVASPVRRARVTLTPTSGAPLITDTDADGRYRFSGLGAGPYALAVVKPGFYVAANGPNGVAAAGTNVQVEHGVKATRDIVVERGASIEGRIVDSDGTPAQDVLVQVRPFGHESAPLMSAIKPARSDDRGRYRLHTLPPGDYIIEAVALSRASPAGPRTAAGGSPTYYPGVARIEDAKPVSVPAQRTVADVDFTFSADRAPTRPVSAPPASAAAAPRPATRISGRVTRADDAVAIAGASVNISPWDPPFNVGGGRAVTDAQGRYEVPVLAGTYRVRVSAAGFVDQTYGSTRGAPTGRPIELADGRSFDKADVAMPTHGAVEGHVLDEFGDPAPGIRVQLATADYSAGATRLVPLVTRVAPQLTDDTGSFRVFGVPPGDYYVMAVSGPFAPDSDATGFALTLYPGTRSGAEARAVSVSAGRDTPAVDFAVVPARMSQVRGVVVNASGGPVSGAYTALLPATGGDVRILLTRASTRTAGDGSFVFRDIPEGSYAVQAETPSFATTAVPYPMPLFGYSAFDVSEATPAAIRVEAHRPATLSGRVVFDGPAPHPTGRDVRISRVAMDFLSAPYETLLRIPQWADVDTFTLEGQVGRAMIRATARPDSWVLARVTRAGRDVTDTPMDFGRGDVDDLEITFKRIGASVSGRVTDGNKVADDYSVIIFAADPLKWAWPSRFLMLGRPNQQGEYRVTGLPPGEYLAVALPQVVGSAWWSSELLSTLVGKATRFQLLDGEARTLMLKLAR